MASRRELILQEVETLLLAVGKPAALTVHRSRARPLTQDSLPATVVYVAPEGDEPSDTGHDDPQQHRLTVRLEHRVKGNPPEQLLDPLTTWATRQIMLDPRLSGLAYRTNEGRTQFAAEETGDGTFGVAAQDFVVIYHANRADPEQA